MKSGSVWTSQLTQRTVTEAGDGASGYHLPPPSRPAFCGWGQMTLELTSVLVKQGGGTVNFFPAVLQRGQGHASQVGFFGLKAMRV